MARYRMVLVMLGIRPHCYCHIVILLCVYSTLDDLRNSGLGMFG